MPLFDFKCNKCGTQKNDELVSGDSSVNCDICGEQMVKLPSNFSFTFTPHGISHYKKKMGNTIPPETVSHKGDVNLYGVPRSS